MIRYWPSAAIALACALTSQSVLACRVFVPINFNDISYADAVIVGQISNYHIVRDYKFCREFLNRPNLSPESRKIYKECDVLGNYAKFEVAVVEILAGNAPKRFSVTWDNSTFGEPENLDGGSFLIGLREPSSKMPPLRGPSATILPNREPDTLTLLQAPCSSAFLFESSSKEAQSVREILNSAPTD